MDVPWVAQISKGQSAEKALIHFSMAQREQLKKDKSDLFSHYSKIWDIHKRHMVPDLPSNYIFFLKACYEPFCDHPVCQHGKPSNPHLWYSPLLNIRFHVPDPIRPWGIKIVLCAKEFVLVTSLYD